MMHLLVVVVVVVVQLYKQTVEAAVLEFIPLTVSTILLQPSQKARQDPSFNKEVYVDFVAVQIKFLSFLAYIIRIFQDQVREGCGCGYVMPEGVRIILRWTKKNLTDDKIRHLNWPFFLTLHNFPMGGLLTYCAALKLIDKII